MLSMLAWEALLTVSLGKMLLAVSSADARPTQHHTDTQSVRPRVWAGSLNYNGDRKGGIACAGQVTSQAPHAISFPSFRDSRHTHQTKILTTHWSFSYYLLTRVLFTDKRTSKGLKSQLPTLEKWQIRLLEFLNSLNGNTYRWGLCCEYFCNTSLILSKSLLIPAPAYLLKVTILLLHCKDKGCCTQTLAQIILISFLLHSWEFKQTNNLRSMLPKR